MPHCVSFLVFPFSSVNLYAFILFKCWVKFVGVHGVIMVLILILSRLKPPSRVSNLARSCRQSDFALIYEVGDHSTNMAWFAISMKSLTAAAPAATAAAHLAAPAAAAAA